MIERKLDLELNDCSAILLSLLNFATALFIALLFLSGCGDSRSQQANHSDLASAEVHCMKLLVQRWASPRASSTISC
jgi:hypothetical protein